MKALLDKETMTLYAKVRIAAYAQILSFQVTLEAFKEDPQGQRDNLDENIKAIHKLVNSVTSDLDNRQLSSEGRDAISTTIAAAKYDERELDHELLEKFSAFEKNQRETIEKIDQLEKTFVEEITLQNLSHANIKLVTPLTRFTEGNRNCWRNANLRDEDVKSGYDARRVPITDDIIDSIHNNLGTILYGKPYYGKSIILKRIMFELIQENGYAVLYIDTGNLKADANTFVELLDRVTADYPSLLVIADDVHKSGSEVFFQAFNKFTEREESSVRFLFSARKEEFDITKETISDWKIRREIDDALNKIKKPFIVTFEKDDAILYLRQALFVTYFGRSEFSEDYIKESAQSLYDYSNGDPFMFAFAIRYSLLEGKAETFNFIETDIKKKIESLDKEEKLWGAALLCSFMGIFGLMPIVVEEGSFPASKLLLDCNVCQEYLEYLSLSNIGFLLKDERGRIYRTRHEQWALEFLIYVYDNYFNSYLNQLFEKRGYELGSIIKIKQLIKSGIKQYISCILNNLEINDHLTVINRCSSLYAGYRRSKSLCDLIVDNYTIPDRVNSEDKSLDYYIALGNLLRYKGDYTQSLRFLDEAIAKDSDNAVAWGSKGYVLKLLGKYEDSIACSDKSINLDPNIVNVWNNKASALANLKKYDEAIECTDKALKIDPDNAYVWGTKGYVLNLLGKYEEAIECSNRAIEIDPRIANVWNNKAISLSNLGRNEEAIECSDRALDIDSENAIILTDRCYILNSLGKYEKAIEYCDKALRSDGNNVTALNNKAWGLRSLERHDEAIVCFSKAIEVDPNFGLAWYNRASSRVKKGDIDSGLKDLSKAIEIDKQQYIELAKEDKDFESVRNDARFAKLITAG